MMNTALINAAIDLVTNINEANRIYETRANVQTRVENWYNHIDAADAETLAALALTGDFNPTFTDYKMAAAKDYYFPAVSHAFHINEIESALFDALWR